PLLLVLEGHLRVVTRARPRERSTLQDDHHLADRLYRRDLQDRPLRRRDHCLARLHLPVLRLRGARSYAAGTEGHLPGPVWRRALSGRRNGIRILDHPPGLAPLPAERG